MLNNYNEISPNDPDSLLPGENTPDMGIPDFITGVPRPFQNNYMFEWIRDIFVSPNNEASARESADQQSEPEIDPELAQQIDRFNRFADHVVRAHGWKDYSDYLANESRGTGYNRQCVESELNRHRLRD